MDGQIPLAAAVSVGLLLVAAGVAVPIVIRAAARGRLSRNVFAGLRTRSTLRSDAAWRGGHHAGRSAGDLAGAGLVAAGVALPFLPGPAAVLALGLVAGAWAVGWLWAAVSRANRAADTVGAGRP